MYWKKKHDSEIVGRVYSPPRLSPSYVAHFSRVSILNSIYEYIINLFNILSFSIHK
jgi:hypothetical protein